MTDLPSALPFLDPAYPTFAWLDLALRHALIRISCHPAGAALAIPNKQRGTPYEIRNKTTHLSPPPPAHHTSLETDFCIWGPPIANSTIADTEAETVAWCTKPGHGARTIPPGTLTGVQFLHAPAYVLVTGLLAQQNINIQADDDGGEMDPHGADEVRFA